MFDSKQTYKHWLHEKDHVLSNFVHEQTHTLTHSFLGIFGLLLELVVETSSHGDVMPCTMSVPKYWQIWVGSNSKRFLFFCWSWSHEWFMCSVYVSSISSICICYDMVSIAQIVGGNEMIGKSSGPGWSRSHVYSSYKKQTPESNTNYDSQKPFFQTVWPCVQLHACWKPYFC